ncbi:RNA 2',3'-cyclic phosphodiesterase [Vibrio sp. V1B]|uniref:RNA 2',3'-cyclic phosphodiesterase n=1 Tax=Vibrio harveyi group TaxID=717610 RepID=UPI00039B8D52|nr:MULTISPECIES: RNA 2',3'-cyclic phosphodiesterase [Vibrio harveyi group]PAW11635.1 RNA 2',3'-cyclic phosphodiesterase [Vibrio sp. V1B]
MRLFFALTFDQRSKSLLKQIQDRLQQQGIAGRYTCEDNFHITLAFIGESTEEETQRLIDIFHQLRSRCEQITVDHLGSFRQSGRQLAWLGIKDNLAVTTLQNELIEAIELHGFVTESRDYVPHITLARHVDQQASLYAVEISPLLLPIYSIALMESKTVNGKLVYHALEEVVC